MPIGVARGSLRTYAPSNDKFRIYAYGSSLVTLWPGLNIIEEEPYAQGESASVEGHRVTRYPGDPGYTRAAHNRKVYINRGKSGASTTPGKNFWIEVPYEQNGKTKYKSHQFTYTGEWPRLLEQALEDLDPTWKIRRESSVAKEVPAAAGP
jgi:hypothetical protein